MSGTLPFYIKMATVAAVDLWVGNVLSYLIDSFFREKFTLIQTDRDWKWKHDFLVASAQAAVTVISADQVRNMLYPPNFEDPTGGVVFMMSILRQPSFWEKVDFVVEGGSMMVPEFLMKESPIMEERPIEPRPFQNSLISLASRTTKPNVNLNPNNVLIQP